MKISLGKEILGKNPQLFSFSERFEYKDGQRGPQIGLWLEIFLPEAGFDKMRGAYPDLTLPVTREEIESRNVQFFPFKVEFEGFSASPYVDRSGWVAYSAKTEAICFPEIIEEG